MRRDDSSKHNNNHLEPFKWLRREVDSLFDSFWERSHRESKKDVDQEKHTFLPDIDISESADEFKVVAELPGIEEKHIKVEMQGNLLHLTAEKKVYRENKDISYHRIERMSGTFNRSIQLPTLIDEDHVEAVFKHGVLTIKLPKALKAEAKTKRVEIKTK